MTDYIFDFSKIKLKINNRKQYSIKNLFEIFFYIPHPDTIGKNNWAFENKQKIIKFLCYSKNLKVKTKPENEEKFTSFLKKLKILVIEQKYKEAQELINQCDLVKVVDLK